ncbi:MAG TPA: hypothetical protein EYO39_09990 [Nitrospirales bacterium]|nr:hypothetical protein [Nitrospirales bacterium]
MSKICGGSLLFGALIALSGVSWAATESPNDFTHRNLDAIEPFASQLSDTLGAESFEAAVARAASLLGVHADSTAVNPTIGLHFSSLPVYSLVLKENSLTVSFMDAILLDDFEKMYIEGGPLVMAITTSQSEVAPQFVTEVTLTTNNAFSVVAKTIGKTVQLTLMPPNEDLDQDFLFEQQAAAPVLVQSAIREYQLRHAAILRAAVQDYSKVKHQISSDLDSAKLKILELELAQIEPASTTSHSRLASSINSFNEATSTLTRKFEYDQSMYAQTIQKANSLRHPMDNQSMIETIDLLIKKLDTALLNIDSTVLQLKDRVEVAQRLVSQTHQATASIRIPNEDTNGFASLDIAVAQIESINSSVSAASFDTLEFAMDEVTTANPELDLALQSNAAIRTTADDTLSNSLTPPVKRERPAFNSITSASTDTRGKMSTLKASVQELNAAQEQGMLVMAQNTDVETLTDEARPDTQTDGSSPEPRRIVVGNDRKSKPNFNLYNPELPADQDPLRQLVNIDFQDMELANVVSLLAQKGQIDVIASVDLSGKVNANLTNIPLGRAIEVVLRMNDLGILEETGIYRITTYEEAIASRQDTEMIFLQTAEAQAIKDTLDEIISQGSGGGGQRTRIGVNTQSNIIIISGPRDRVDDLVNIIEQLDIAEPVIPTENKAFRLNYADPKDMAAVIEPILSENGNVTPDERSGQVIVTDIPVKIVEIGELIQDVDIPVEQVSIEAMVVDHNISDDSHFGSQIFANGSELLTDVNGVIFEEFSASTNNLAGPATGQVAFGFVDKNIAIGAIIGAEVSSGNAQLLANPTIVTLENKTAIIDITTAFPFLTVTGSGDGPDKTSVGFLDIGTILEVTPKITYDNKIITKIIAEQSNVDGIVILNASEVPRESKRVAETTMRMDNGQTVYIAGLRRFDEVDTELKVPILGDIPILNIFFKSRSTTMSNTELMIFLTCNIIPDNFNELSPYQKDRYDTLGGIPPEEINATKKMIKAYGRDQMRDPTYKWRRPK